MSAALLSADLLRKGDRGAAGPLATRRRLGSTELYVSSWCLGCNPFGWTVRDRQAFAVLDAYVAAEGNFLDTADVYPPGSRGGASEQMIGRWMAARRAREKIVLATKIGAPRHSGEVVDLSYGAVRRRTEESLRRLRVNHIDLLYAHLDDETTPLEETLGALDELVRAGKVRYIAASNYRAARLAQAFGVSRLLGLAAYSVLQTHYNLLERRQILGERARLTDAYEGPLADVCTRNGVGVVAYWALAKGFLTGKYRPHGEPDEGPQFSDRARAQRPRDYLENQRGLGVLHALDQVAAAHAVTDGAVALAWTVAQGSVVTAVASARTVEQVAQLAAMARVSLSEEEHRRLDFASNEPVPAEGAPR